MKNAYKVVIDKKGCSKCKSGRMWTIEGPDGVWIGTSWGDKEITQDVCDLMNMAYDRAREHFQ